MEVCPYSPQSGRPRRIFLCNIQLLPVRNVVSDRDPDELRMSHKLIGTLQPHWMTEVGEVKRVTSETIHLMKGDAF